MLVMIRGGGDLASGVALRLYHAGLKMVITEIAQPLVVRRLVSFAEAVYQGKTTVENVTSRLARDFTDVSAIIDGGDIPVLVDPQVESLTVLYPDVLIDARMMKKPPSLGVDAALMVIGLGPGFVAGENCHAVIETNRGHRLGRVVWRGSPEADTGIPEKVLNRRSERVLRAPADGVLITHAEICDHLEAGKKVAEVSGEEIFAPFSGVLRGILHPGVTVVKGLKIGDVDPRDDPCYCRLVSDKSLAVGGGVLEAILARPELRSGLWD